MLNTGDMVLIIGYESDFTDHLDGKTGVVVLSQDEDSIVRVKNRLGEDEEYWCWNENLIKIDGPGDEDG